MKYFIFTIFITLTLFSKNINYLNNYEEALKNAKKENKLLYVLITSPSCQWCRKFESTTLKNTLIQDRLNEEFITLHLSLGRDNIDKKFKTSPVPRHYFTDTSGEILYSALGYRDQALFDSFMDNAQDRYKKNKIKNKDKNEIRSNR